MRKIVAVSFALSFTLCAGLLAGRVQADDPKPCTSTTFATPQVKAACERGGQAEAKKVMNAAIKKAKEAGEVIKCKDCHSDLTTFALTPDAVDKLKPLL